MAMESMDHDPMHGNNGMNNEQHPMHMMKMKMKMHMHMTFFWGKDAEILFSGWPGTRTGMYVLALILVFALGFTVEGISHSRLVKPGSTHLAAGLVQTLLHAFRVGLAYLVMLAVMSFNGGVFLAAVAGHTLGFLLFGSRVFKKSLAPPPPPPPPHEKTSDLPPLTMSC